MQRRTFEKEGRSVVWRENDGHYGGTQIWFEYCEHATYRNTTSVSVEGVYPFVFTGVNPVGMRRTPVT